MDILTVLQRIKREWTPDRFTTRTFARDGDGNRCEPTDEAAQSFCFVGKLYSIIPAAEYETMAQEIANEMNDRLEEKKVDVRDFWGNPDRTIITTNDSPNGYEILTGIINDMLKDRMPKATESAIEEEIETRELVGV